MSSQWDLGQQVVDQLCELVRAGWSVCAAAKYLGVREYVAYRIAYEYELPLQRKRRITEGEQKQIVMYWETGMAPMDIARTTGVKCPSPDFSCVWG